MMENPLPGDPATRSTESPSPSDLLQWEAALEPPEPSNGTPAEPPAPAVLVIRERPPRSLVVRLLPAALLVLLASGLLAMRSSLNDWPGLLGTTLSDLAHRLNPPSPRTPPVPAPAGAPAAGPAPAALPAPKAEAPAMALNQEPSAEAAPGVAPPQVEPQLQAVPEAPKDQTEAALAAIEEEARKKKAEQDELARLKDKAAQDMPPPAAVPPGPFGGLARADIEQFQRRARALHREQLAEMRQMLEEANRRHNAMRRQMGMPPMPDLPPLADWMPFGMDDEDDAPPVPAWPNRNLPRLALPQPVPVEPGPPQPGEIRTFRFGPDGRGRGEMRQFTSPDGRTVGFEMRLEQSGG